MRELVKIKIGGDRDETGRIYEVLVTTRFYNRTDVTKHHSLTADRGDKR